MGPKAELKMGRGLRSCSRLIVLRRAWVRVHRRNLPIFQRLLEQCHHLRDVLGDDAPYGVQVHLVVRVDENVPHADDARPGQGGHAGTRLLADARGGFADDLDAADQRVPEFDVAAVQLPSGTWTSPPAKAQKRFVNGKGDDLAFYYEALRSQA